MALPKLTHPTFSLTLPSTKQEVVFRPFLVKEEKLLLIAQSGGDSADIVRAIKQVIANCIETPGIDVDDFTSFDLEYFFIKLRARSVNNLITLSYKDRDDNQVYDVQVDLDQIEVVGNEHDSQIEIGEDTTLKLRYPRVSLIDDVSEAMDELDFNFLIMASCLDALFIRDEVHYFRDHSKEEIAEFLDQLDVKVYEQVQRFIDTMPRIEHTVSYTNSNGKLVEIKLTTLTDFFMLG